MKTGSESKTQCIQENTIYKTSDGLKLKDILCEEFVARSPQGVTLLKQIRKVAKSKASILITGDSGTGKELVARICHRLSDRKSKPFIAINCAALPENLLESELFGYEKGSFTGALQNKEGIVKRAQNGTLFLDEIGDMSIEMQAKLLRLTQEKSVRPIGSHIETPVDIRIISATNKNLFKAIKTNKFREDLYFRLSVIPLFIPKLADRKTDIIPLSIHFINRICSSYSIPPKQISVGAKDILLDYTWPGNVRELSNVLERAILFSENNFINEDHIMFDYNYFDNIDTQDNLEKVPVENLNALEAMAIKQALEKTNGKKSQAAKRLGIDRTTLLRKEKLYQIPSNM